MKKINQNPQSVPLISAWNAAKEAERAWAEHRRSLEEQILALHPGVLEAMEIGLRGSQAMSVSAELGTLKVEVKRSAELDQVKLNEVVAEHPYLVGTLLKCTWGLISSRPLFSLLARGDEVSKALAEGIKFKLQRPYFSHRTEAK